MKKSIFFLSVFITIVFYADAQADMQISICTDRGIITVSKTADGRDMIIISIACWDEIVKGTKYQSSNLPRLSGRKLCMEIADHKHGSCRKGIGFGCGIFDCPDVPGTLVNRVDNENRICSVTVRKIKGAVKIVFNDKVDWQSLQNSKVEMQHF